jgi:hypothetical protein
MTLTNIYELIANGSPCTKFRGPEAISVGSFWRCDIAALTVKLSVEDLLEASFIKRNYALSRECGCDGFYF